MDFKKQQEEIKYTYEFIIKLLNANDLTPYQKQELWNILDYLVWAVLNK